MPSQTGSMPSQSKAHVAKSSLWARNWRADEGTDVYLSFMDRSTRTAYPDEDVVTARVTCHNRDLPRRLRHVDDVPTHAWPR